jgi:hypothetical protein
MNALLLLRSRRAAVPALLVLLLGAAALAALRLDIPAAAPSIELFLFAALGAAVGRLTAKTESSESASAGAGEPAQKSEAVDQLLRSIARLIQKHLAESDSFSVRLNGATRRLSQHV